MTKSGSAFWLSAPLFLALGLAVSAQAQSTPPGTRPLEVPAQADSKPSETKPTDAKAAKAPAIPPAKQMDRLFERLQAAKTPNEAKGVAGLITRRWARSGSDTSDLLMTRLQQAAQKNDLNLAVEIADRIIALEPDWAEGWNQRANLFFRMDDSVRALYDVAETLKREPRHFGALGGLAVLLQQQGKDKAALTAYRELIKIYPLMEGAKQAIEKLGPSVDGRDA